jgi:hypothetical protein
MLTVLASTLSGNSAAFVSSGKAVGGGIDNDTGWPDTWRIGNTILAGNSAPVSSAWLRASIARQTRRPSRGVLSITLGDIAIARSGKELPEAEVEKLLGQDDGTRKRCSSSTSQPMTLASRCWIPGTEVPRAANQIGGAVFRAKLPSRIGHGLADKESEPSRPETAGSTMRTS